ncbi:MAG: DHH family phosphoesterase [Ardenticatenales bacterium]|nr:DHH family phosphoesterase [Ardenticatenales bacterium]
MTAAAPHAATQADAVAAAAGALRQAERVWIGTHVDPDGDAIGSALGLAHILRALGKVATVACQDAPPRDGIWLPGAKDIVASGPGGHPTSHGGHATTHGGHGIAAGGPYDLAVAVDAGDAGRLGTLHAADTWAAQPTLVIDHHISNTGFGDVDCIVPSASSTCEILLAVADALGVQLSTEAATCLLCGIVTDTIGFRTPSTSAATLAAASRLVADGADLADVARRVFLSRPLAGLRLEGRALDRVVMDGPFAISWLSLSDFEGLGAAPEDGRGIVQALATAVEPLAVALLRERHDGTFDVSLRAKGTVDLVPAARALGGGGHALAAGGRTPGPLPAALDAVRQALAAHVAAAER